MEEQNATFSLLSRSTFLKQPSVYSNMISSYELMMMVMIDEQCVVPSCLFSPSCLLSILSTSPNQATHTR